MVRNPRPGEQNSRWLVAKRKVFALIGLVPVGRLRSYCGVGICPRDGRLSGGEEADDAVGAGEGDGDGGAGAGFGSKAESAAVVFDDAAHDE